MRAGRGESRAHEGGRHQGTRSVVDQYEVAHANRRQTRQDRVGALDAALDHRVKGVPRRQRPLLIDVPPTIGRDNERDARQLGDGDQGAQGMLKQRPAREREPQLVHPRHTPAAASRDDDGANDLRHSAMVDGRWSMVDGYDVDGAASSRCIADVLSTIDHRPSTNAYSH